MNGRDRRPLLAAFDEAQFGGSRTLNLRASLPTVSEAVARTEPWLRQQQIERAGTVLIVTGRGNNSPDGVSPVREAVIRQLHSLRRRGVVKAWREDTPGSLVVDLAPVNTLFETPARRREPASRVAADPAGLRALSPATRSALRRLARRSLEALGARNPAPFLEGEMLRQFSVLSASLPVAGDRESSLMDAIQHALEEIDG